MREDFNFYRGKNSIDADDETVYHVLDNGWRTARGYKQGDSLQKLVALYGSLPCNISITRSSVGGYSDFSSYNQVLILKKLPHLFEEKYESLRLEFVHDSYMLVFMHDQERDEISVSTSYPLEHGRFTAEMLIRSLGCSLSSGYSLESALENEEELAALSEEQIAFVVQYAPALQNIHRGLKYEELVEVLEFGPAEKKMFDEIGMAVWEWEQENW